MNKKYLKILYLGDIKEGNTSFQRSGALSGLGHQVTTAQIYPQNLNVSQRIDNWLYRKGLHMFGHRSPSINRSITEIGLQSHFDVLWIDKGLYVTAETIERIKSYNPRIKVVGYSPDYMAAQHNNSRWFIEHSKYYDLFVTTKSYSAKWLKRVGCKAVLFQGNAYDPATHKPVKLSPEEKENLGGGVGFIGTYEKERADFIRFLGINQISVKVYGNDWEKAPVMDGVNITNKAMIGNDYARVICSFDINLCFLRKINLDFQTTRSIEIPACGAFMLAERSKEHLELFKEGKEAEFFEGKAELLDKCRFYLKHPTVREKIAKSGRKRCLVSGYSNQARLKKVLTVIKEF